MVITIVLIIIAGIFKAFADAIAHGKTKYLGKYFDKDESWKFKYKDNDPSKGPKFFLSTTVLVFTTDFWHLSNFIFTSALQLAIAILLYKSFLYIILAFIAIKTIFNVSFELFYRLISKTD